MGYARYETPLGAAGYSVQDSCHHPDCAVRIDRGLSYLCGEQPGVAADGACGRWFCADHLHLTQGEDQRCAACLGAWLG